MALRKGLFSVGALALLLLAYPTWAQFGREGAAGLSGGIRAGALISITEFDGGVGPTAVGFVRYGLMENWEGELSVGYGQYKGDGDAADWAALLPLPTVDLMGDKFSTDMALMEARLLYSPFDYEKWNPYFFLGAGAIRYDLDKQFIRTSDIKSIDWTMIMPVGVGAQYKLSDSWAFEMSGAYTYSMTDGLDGGSTEKGNDAYLTATVGLTMGDFRSAIAPPVPTPPPPKPEVLADQDYDGLTDQDEKTVYYTNPLMADSDGDGLSDGDEVKVYRTDPNKADTDGGSVSDGEEIDRGTDPLDADDDAAVEIEERAIPMLEEKLPIISFSFGGVEFSDQAVQKLNMVVQLLQQNKGILVEVRGYTDNVGYSADNMRLSWKRAQMVKSYLVDQGVSGWRLTPKALGEQMPVAGNDTAEGRARNRRVELVPVP